MSDYIFGMENFWFVLGFFIAIIGAFASIRHAFTKSEKQKTELKIMFLFATYIYLITGLVATLELLKTSEGWWLILPVINFVSVFVYIKQFAGEKRISEKQAEMKEIVPATIIILLIVAGSQYLMQNSWYITLGITTSISGIAHTFIFGYS